MSRLLVEAIKGGRNGGGRVVAQELCSIMKF